METMSWFDATGFANLAKTALKEAQKTIDKALDIKEEDVEHNIHGSLPCAVPVEGVPRSESEPQLSTVNKLNTSASLWGSFTGSFFENPKAQENESGSKEAPARPTNLISHQPKKAATFRPPTGKTQTPDSNSPPAEEEPPEEGNPADIREEILSFPPVVYRKKEPRNYSNRLSAISSESDRRSSSSCEVLGSCTPDSEPPPSLSSSSSGARLRQSGSFESVEVLTSPSSVEVLGSSSSENRYSSDSVSPLVEGEDVPELVEDSEPSVAEDSYTSASETLTSGTVLDLHHTDAVRDLMLKSTSSLDTSLTEPPRDSVGSDCMSSCEEGTLMGSSGEETTLHNVSSTSYLKTLLADAMTEQSPSHRDHSPISSESRSDMIKVGSSGHTSGDELETTTSSDIEIISSPTPNGDSSSATSRQSPARLCMRGKIGLGTAAEPLKTLTTKTKGHQRELSEVSSGGSDDGSEVDKLLKRISEMTEILEVREARLVDLSRINSDLQESNSDLQKQLESRLQKQDVSELSEEFTQRLAALERKFQQAIREKEVLRKQLEQARVAAAAAEEEAEKDQVITDLRAEGDKLSKQQLTLNNLIKKLRATEKENQKVITSLKEQLEECNQELDRSKRALSAKQDVERSQIEAVHQLTRTNQRLEAQTTALQAQVDGLTSTVVSLQKEVTEGAERSAQLQTQLAEARAAAETDVRQKLEAEWAETAEQRDQLESEVQQLRERLDQQMEQHDRQVQELRREQAELVRRLEAAGAVVEDVAQSVSAATQPLVRQIDSLTAAHSQAQATWERQERKLLQQMSELQTRVAGLVESERAVREQLVAGNTRCTALEARLATTLHDLETVQAELYETRQKLKQRDQDSERLLVEHEAEVRQLRAELAEKERETRGLEQQLSVERAALEAERRRVASIQEQARRRGPSPPASPPSSPTLSLGRVSVADSMSSNIWPSFGDDVFETGSASGRLSSVYDSLRPGNTTSLLEGLQSQLKQRDGEVHQLQWELSRRDVERAALSNELAALTAQVEMQDKQLAALGNLRTEYDALLLLYGEKLEESQELRMDLQDVKDMYKTQIDQLLKKEPNS